MERVLVPDSWAQEEAPHPSPFILDCDEMWARKSPDELIYQSNVTITLRHVSKFRIKEHN